MGKLKITTGEYGKDLVDFSSEEKYLGFEFYPVPPITIDKVSISMEDEGHGDVYILLSNGHSVEYQCREVRGNCGFQTEMSVSVGRPNATGYQICGNEFGETYLSNYGGSWINAIMNCYRDYHVE